jgi:peroxiredoxin (alkyl hydroperoxide reductase subunit C)
MEAKVGKPAPEIVTRGYFDGAIDRIKLSDYRGKWVILYFYPGDFTFVCPTELTTIAYRYKEFEEIDTIILSISTDSPFTHKAWQEHELMKMVEGGLPFPMLSDPGGRIGQKYGVYDEEDGVNIRGRFIIDPDGILQAMEILAEPVGRHVKEMIRQIKAFRLTRNTGEALPADWEPGKQTFKPSPDIVGKIHEMWKPGKK